MEFLTKEGQTFKLGDKSLQQLKRDYPKKDVIGTLRTLQEKLESGQYSYSFVHMTQVIRKWMGNAPDIGSEKPPTVSPDRSRHPSLVAEREAQAAPQSVRDDDVAAAEITKMKKLLGMRRD